MHRTDEQPHTALLVPGSLVLAAILLGLLWTVYQTITAIWTGAIPAAGAYGSLVVGLATFLLVCLTAGYAYFTREQVAEMRRAREADHRRQLRSLRRGLRYEINALPVDRIASMNFRDTKRHQHVASRTVFENNADRVGLLSDEEVDAILTYYRQLDRFEEYLVAYSQREGGGNIQDRAEPLIQAKEDAVNALDYQLM